MKMKKISRYATSLILAIMLLISSTLTCFASEFEDSERARPGRWLNHIDVYTNGTISVDTQINGVSQGVKTGTLVISNLTATVNDYGYTNTYSDFSTQSQVGSGELEFHKDVWGFSTSAVITISGTMICDELGINTTFTKEISGDSLAAAVQECPGRSGCDIRITEDEVNNTITHNVTFRTEAGGTINSDTVDIAYTNIIDGSAFPKIPITTPNEHYEFDGWYDEGGNKVESFPSIVTEDRVFVAKWRQVSTDPTPVTPVSAKYQVKHYLEQLDGSYKEVAEDAQMPTGEIGATVTANPNTYENYTFNAEKSTTTGTVIKPEVVDGSLNILTLELYYDLNSVEYRVEHYLQDEPKSGKYTLKDTETPTGKLGASVTAEPKEYDKYEFNSSKSTVTGTVVEGLVLKLYYDLKTADPAPVTPVSAKYQVKHYLEQLDGSYKEVAEDAQMPTGKIGATVTANPNTYENYTFNAEKSTTTGTVIKPEVVDGSLNILTLELYYDLNSVEYRVEHYLQDEPKSGKYTLKDTETFTAKVGANVTAEIKDYTGYTYNVSKSTVRGTVTANGLVLKLYYDLRAELPEPVTPTSANYYVRHYLEQQDGSYKEVMADAQMPTGKIGATVTAKPNTYKNYTYNAEKSIATGTVIEPEVVDGNLNILTLKLYYDLNSVEYRVEYYLQDKPDSGKYNLKETGTFTAKVGANVTAEIKDYTGYTYNVSKSTVRGTVTANGLVLKLYYDLKKDVPTPVKPDPTNPTPTTPTTPNNDTSATTKYVPRTGENNSKEISLVVMALSMLGIAVTTLNDKKKKRAK